MYEKRFLRPVDELGNLKQVVEYLSRNASETLRAKV
jgi:hypothetical protein